MSVRFDTWLETHLSSMTPEQRKAFEMECRELHLHINLTLAAQDVVNWWRTLDSSKILHAADFDEEPEFKALVAALEAFDEDD